MFTRDHTGITRKITVLVIGDTGCGKSSLCASLHKLDPKHQSYEIPVVGVQTRSSCHTWNNVDVELTTWDLSLSDIQLIPMTNTPFDYVALCFKADKRSSLQNAKTAFSELRKQITQNTKFLLVGCKSDTLQYLMSSEATDYILVSAQVAKRLNLPLVFTSSRKNFCMNELREAFFSSYIDKKKFKSTLRNFISSKLE